MHMDKTQNLIKISRFNDVININAFIAERPERVKLTYKMSTLTGLWQLDITYLENKKTLTIGNYIDGIEDRITKYNVVAKWYWPSYVEEFDGGPVLWTGGGFVVIELPHRGMREVVLVTPQICSRTDPLREPVYIWRSVDYFNVLDCGGGLYMFRTREEFEKWVKNKKSEDAIHWPEDAIHWQEWYIIPSTTRGNEDWLDALMHAIRGPAYPSAEEVLALI